MLPRQATSLIFAALATLCHGAATGSPSTASTTTSSSSSSMSCRDVAIPIDVSAANRNLPASLNVSTLTSSFLNDVLAGVPALVTGGNFTIAGRYCEPENFVAARQHTLQLLVHGITYTRNYWSGLADPGTKPGQDRYSWIKYASQQGYPTLSVDRLCNGVSSRPSGLLACQVPLQAETMHAVIGAARTGTIPGVPTKFARILYVGHSYGSLVASGLALQHPGDADALLMTGFSDQLLFGEAGVTLEPLWMPAAVVDPKEHSHDDVAYIMATSSDGAKELFYYGGYDPALLAYDYAHRQTTTLGELGTVTFGQLKAPEYAGPLMVLNGDHDTVFCEENLLSPGVRQYGDCSDAVDQRVKSFFPKTSTFKYVNAPNTGHCLNNHYTAQDSFKAAHDFLAALGY